MGLLAYITGILLATVTAVIYSRSDLLFLFYANAPARVPSINTFGSSEVLFADVVRNCEDAVFSPADGFLVLSCDPGRDTWNTVMGTYNNSAAPPDTGLYFYNHAAAAPGLPEKLKLLDFNVDARNFHPLGIEYHAQSQKLFVINHALSGPKIEIFKLLVKDRAATHISSIAHPLLMAPNSLTSIAEDEIFVTNDHYFPSDFSKVLSLAETYTALPLGSVVHIKLSKKGTAIEEVRNVARMSFANGIVSLNDSTLAVVSLTGPAINLYDLERLPGRSPKLTRKQSIKVPFLPDNLSLDGNGKLLVAGHPFPPSLEKIAKNQQFCHGAETADDEKCQFDRLSWVAEWSEEEGLKTLYAGRGFGTSTTAVRDSTTGVGYVVGLYEKGILRFKD